MMRTLLRRILFVLLLLCMGSSLCGTWLMAQEHGKAITVKIENKTLKEAIDIVKANSDYSFLIRNNDVDLNRHVSVSVSEGTINQVMIQMLGDTDISYEVNGKRVIIFHVDTPKTLSGNRIALKGRVTDSNGEGVIGANVKVIGSNEGAITDVNGNFSVQAALGKQLSISFIGYATQIVMVKEQRSLNVVLKEDTELMDEVVVVGYGVQKKANLTGAVSSVKMDEILGDRPVVSVSNALVGSMPGLQVTGTSGKPGDGMDFNIRGINSINKASPLVLVDNVEMDINMLDPNDIESVTVLKDAASAAIYGARAAFGVILITTKKEAGDSSFKLNYSNNFSFSRPANMPRKATPLQTVQGYKDAGTISAQTGQDVDTWFDLLKQYQQNPSAYSDGYTMVGAMRYNLAETDLFKDMTETGFQQTHNIAVDGGSKQLAYRMAAGIVSQDGVLATNKDSYKRYTVSSYIRSNAVSWITPELDIKYANSKASLPESSVGYGIWGGAVAFPSYFPVGEGEFNDEVLPYNTPRNIIELAYPTTTNKNDIRILGRVTITPFKDFRVVTEYTFNRKSEGITSFDKKFSYLHGGNFMKQESVSNSKYTHSEANTNYNALNVFGTYSKTLGNHDFSVMGGFNQESNDYQFSKMSRTDMINEDLPSISQATGDYKAEDDFKKYTVRGLFYRLNYSYAGKYLLETNGRYDGSSKFPKNSRFGFFPSVSAGWRVSEEAFMGWSKSILSNLKIRGSWGNIGNQSIDPYAYIPGMDSPLANWLVNGLATTTLAPPKLVSRSFTWEKVSTIDGGLDIGLFNNRLNVVFDYYRRDTKGMLAPGMELPGVLGADAPLQNAANLRSNGWELSVDWNDRIGQVQYYVGFNLYDSRTKITKFDNEVGLLRDKNDKLTYRTGMELGEIWGFVTDRLYMTDDFDANGKLKAGVPRVEGINPNPGDILYKDFDNNGIINNGKNTALESGDTQIIGNNTRRYQYGIKGGASWKNVSLSFLLQGVGKRDLWLMNELVYPFYDPWSTLFDSQLDYWTPETPDSYFPRLYDKAAGNTTANQKVQTRYLQNGAYLSIRNITLSYAFPKQWIGKAGFNGLSVFFSGENLYTFDHLPKGLDPERSVTDDLGARGFTYPYMRQFSFGVNITL